MVLQQRFIPEHHIIISMEVFHELVPAWRMLHSSTSALGHDQTDEHGLSNRMLSDCLVIGSQQRQYCIRLSLSHSRVWFVRTAHGTFFPHPGHIEVGTVAVSDSWVRLELTLLCTFDVLWTRLEPSSQLLCRPGLGATRQLELDQLSCTLRPCWSPEPDMQPTVSLQQSPCLPACSSCHTGSCAENRASCGVWSTGPLHPSTARQPVPPLSAGPASLCTHGTHCGQVRVRGCNLTGTGCDVCTGARNLWQLRAQ